MIVGKSFQEIVDQAKDYLVNVQEKNEYRVHILSNITCNQLSTLIVAEFRSIGINVEVTIGSYDNIVQESFKTLKYDMVIVHYDLYAQLDKSATIKELLTNEQSEVFINEVKEDIDTILRNMLNVPRILFNSFLALNDLRVFCSSKIPQDLIARELNGYLGAYNDPGKVDIVDMSKILSTIGFDKSIDMRMFSISKSLYTVSFWSVYVDLISNVALEASGLLKKAIIFDCDNTLWKGIIGEDGDNGISMSSSHSKEGENFEIVQKIAVWLSNNGVLVGLCSKNNEEDVINVFQSHKDSILKMENIVSHRINWNDKASNLREIASELNIGLDSLVFIDDSSFEINLVKEQIPEVLTYQVPINGLNYPKELLQIVSRNFKQNLSLADLEKTKQYKAQSQRKSSQEAFENLDDYLKSINIKLTFLIDDYDNVTRISELTRKTNQFNLTTKRYSDRDISSFMDSINFKVISIRVEDKFGDNGWTGVVILEKKDKIYSIDSFIMSCRIMGRKIEKSITDYIFRAAIDNGIEKIEAFYFETKKNVSLSHFYSNEGFEIVEEYENGRRYEQTVSLYKFNNLTYEIENG